MVSLELIFPLFTYFTVLFEVSLLSRVEVFTGITVVSRPLLDRVLALFSLMTLV